MCTSTFFVKKKNTERSCEPYDNIKTLLRTNYDNIFARYFLVFNLGFTSVYVVSLFFGSDKDCIYIHRWSFQRFGGPLCNSGNHGRFRTWAYLQLRYNFAPFSCRTISCSFVNAFAKNLVSCAPGKLNDRLASPFTAVIKKCGTPFTPSFLRASKIWSATAFLKCVRVQNRLCFINMLL